MRNFRETDDGSPGPRGLRWGKAAILEKGEESSSVCVDIIIQKLSGRLLYPGLESAFLSLGEKEGIWCDHQV